MAIKLQSLAEQIRAIPKRHSMEDCTCSWLCFWSSSINVPLAPSRRTTGGGTNLQICLKKKRRYISIYWAFTDVRLLTSNVHVRLQYIYLM